MKTTIFLLILCSFTFGYGQKESSTSDFKRFQVGANFSPNACYRNLTDANVKYLNSNVIDFRNDNEVIKFGFTTGLSFVYNFKSWLGIETGVQYNNQGYQTRKNVAIFSLLYNTITPSKSYFTYTFNYIDIPLKVNFIVGQRKVRFFSSLGFSANFLLSSNVKGVINYPDGAKHIHTSNNNSLRRFNLSPMVSVGIDYQIKDYITLRIAPTLRYGVLSNNTTPINEYLWNVGCNVACYFNF